MSDKRNNYRVCLVIVTLFVLVVSMISITLIVLKKWQISIEYVCYQIKSAGVESGEHDTVFMVTEQLNPLLIMYGLFLLAGVVVLVCVLFIAFNDDSDIRYEKLRQLESVNSSIYPLTKCQTALDACYSEEEITANPESSTGNPSKKR